MRTLGFIILLLFGLLFCFASAVVLDDDYSGPPVLIPGILDWRT